MYEKSFHMHLKANTFFLWKFSNTSCLIKSSIELSTKHFVGNVDMCDGIVPSTVRRLCLAAVETKCADYNSPSVL